AIEQRKASAVVTTPSPRIILSLLEGTSITTIAPAIGRNVVMVMAHCCQVVSFILFLVPYLKMNRLSAITPTNSPTAYHWTLPVCTKRRPLPNVSIAVPAPFTAPSLMLRLIHMMTPEPERAATAAPSTAPSSTFWLNQ